MAADLNPPERLFLQVHDNLNDAFAWTHADHRIHDDDVEYVRVARSPEGEDAATTLAKALYSAYADGIINGGGGSARDWDTLGDHQHGWLEDAKRELARLRPSVEAPSEHVTPMALCEVPHLILRKDQLYRFYVAENCDACAEIGAAYDDEATPPTGDTP